MRNVLGSRPQDTIIDIDLANTVHENDVDLVKKKQK